jgi:transcriptional regulator with PAS, ATPase and Fis domain
MVEDVIPNTQMRRVLETGEPYLIDLLTNRAGTFVVSRIPLRDEADAVIGAIGIVLFDHPETTLAPLISKFALMQRDLDDARRELTTQRLRLGAARGVGSRLAKYTFASFIGTSPAAVEVKRQARRAAQSGSPVLLLGETGTGKELLAHGSTRHQPARGSGPLVSVNIAAVPDTLLEAEFFGVAPGAYTGADRKGRDGKFKLADGGTLFLDEIGDMPLACRPSCCARCRSSEIEPLGSNQLVRFDVRVMAATSRDLAAWCVQGSFREDLYYRLNVLPIRVPPLRERRSDIAALVESLGEDMALRSGRPCRSCARSAGAADAPRPGAAISANCAMCWSRRRCAATCAAHRLRRAATAVLRDWRASISDCTGAARPWPQPAPVMTSPGGPACASVGRAGGGTRTGGHRRCAGVRLVATSSPLHGCSGSRERRLYSLDWNPV